MYRKNVLFLFLFGLIINLCGCYHASEQHIENLPVILTVEGSELSDDERSFLEEYHPIGIILFSYNFEFYSNGNINEEKLKKLCDDIHCYCPYVSIDQEGGRVQRLRAPNCYDAPPSGFFTEGINEDNFKEKCEALRRNVQLIDGDLLKFGIDVNFAPCCDLLPRPFDQLLLCFDQLSLSSSQSSLLSNQLSQSSSQLSMLSDQLSLSSGQLLLSPDQLQLLSDLLSLSPDQLQLLSDLLSHQIIGNRSFGSNPKVVSNFASCWGEQMAKDGLIPVLKHCPGHGSTIKDSHHELPVVNKLFDVLCQSDFVIFEDVIGNLQSKGIHFWVMSAHVIYPEIDNKNCATQSKKIIRFMREKFGFYGKIVTDCITMEALKGKLSERAIRSFQSGCDLVLCCHLKLEEKKIFAEEIKKYFALNPYSVSSN